MAEQEHAGQVDEGSRSGSSLFDLRYLIGALFVFYGVVLVVASFFVDHRQSGSIDINLWMGLGMAVFGLLFLGWARWRPLHTGGPSLSARSRRPSGED